MHEFGSVASQNHKTEDFADAMLPSGGQLLRCASRSPVAVKVNKAWQNQNLRTLKRNS
jgi:hypothetical protein